MTILIPYLEFILLTGAIVFPTGLVTIIPLRQTKNFLRNINANTLVVYALLFILVLFAQKEHLLFLRHPPLYFYPIACVAGFLCLVLEYYTGALLIFFRQKQFPKGFNIHDFYMGSKIGVVDVALIFLIVVAEELILRQALFSLFFMGMKLHLWLVIVLCTVIYALNHIYFGLQALPQKIVSGLIYVCLYYYSGMAILVPILAHSVQNLTLVTVKIIRDRNANAAR